MAASHSFGSQLLKLELDLWHILERETHTHLSLDTQHKLKGKHVCSYTSSHTNARTERSLKRGGIQARVSGRRQWLMNPHCIPSLFFLPVILFLLIFSSLLLSLCWDSLIPFFASLRLPGLSFWPRLSSFRLGRRYLLLLSLTFPFLLSSHLSITFIFTRLYLFPHTSLSDNVSVSLHCGSLGFRGSH